MSSSTLTSVRFPNALIEKFNALHDPKDLRSFIRVAVAEKLNREGANLDLSEMEMRKGRRYDLIDNPERLAALAERARNFMQPRSVAAAKLRKKLAKSAEKSAKKSAKTASKTEKKS